MCVHRRIRVLHAQKLTLRSLDLDAIETKNMSCNGVNIRSSSNKTCLWGRGCEQQSADPRGPICAFVIRLLESIISEFASSKILIFQLVTVAEQADLNLNKTLFVASRPIYFLLLYTAIHEHSHPLWKITKLYRNICPETLENHMTKLQMPKYI